MAFVNQRWFDQPDSLLTARGASSRSSIVSPSGEVLGWATNGGIIAPTRRPLPIGTKLVRFGGVGLPSVVVQGGWWLEWSQYKAIENFADKRKIAVPIAVRLLCCVPLEWNDMIMVIQVRLKSGLLAYGGSSAPAVQLNKKTGTTEFLDGKGLTGTGIEQLYIPGMGSADVRHDAVMFEGYGHMPASLSHAGYIIRPAGA